LSEVLHKFKTMPPLGYWASGEANTHEVGLPFAQGPLKATTRRYFMESDADVISRLQEQLALLAEELGVSDPPRLITYREWHQMGEHPTIEVGSARAAISTTS
jgi:hypothetical protein